MGWIKNLFSNNKKQVKISIIDIPDIPKKKTRTDAVSSISTIKTLRKSPLSYAPSRNNYIQSGQFYAPEWNLEEVGIIENVESIVRQAHRRKISLMFKEGYDFVGKNIDTLEYVKARLAQIERATQTPTSDLLKRIGTSLIRLSNAFVWKIRDERVSGGTKRITPNGKALKPIAGYLLLPAETMRIKLDDNGRITKWRQEMPDGRYRDFPPDDIIHFHINKREGFNFGIPDLVPVIDDIRALRNIEENIELLIYQHLFPLFHWKVGTDTHPAGYTPDGYDEISIAKDQMESMPAEGGIVTSHRNEITAVGAEGRAIRAEGYLQYFQRRIIAGLGISAIDIGESHTSNRSTAKVLSRQLIDTVKDIQDALESQVATHIISELLLESPFINRMDVLDKKNMVYLQFSEIDIENKMEQEKHYIELFNNNAITHSELRQHLGREPIDIPTGDDEWAQTYWELFKKPELELKLQSQLIRAEQQQPNNNNAPITDFYQEYQQLKNDLIQLSSIPSDIHTSLNVWGNDVKNKLTNHLQNTLIDTVGSYYYGQMFSKIQDANTVIERRVNRIINKFINDLLKLLETKQNVASVFDSMAYRVRYIMDTEFQKVKNYGNILVMYIESGKQIFDIEIKDTTCSICSKAQPLDINNISSFTNIPPLHPNCKCKILF